MKEAIGKIKLLAMDVDGVLTDGGILLHDDGTETKKFNVRDGAWIRIWQRAGFGTAIITGRYCKAVAVRAEQLEIGLVYQKAVKKLEAFDLLLKETGLGAEEIAYIGDDVMDLPVLRRVGFGAAPADAVAEVREEADFVTESRGGRGAVYELVRMMLREKGLWEAAMERYRV